MIERRLWRIQTRINTRRLFEITGPVIDRRLPVRIREALRRLGKGAATELPLCLLIGCQDQPDE